MSFFFAKVPGSLRRGLLHLGLSDVYRWEGNGLHRTNRTMTLFSIFNSILNEKMLNFCFEKCIFFSKKKIVKICQNFGKQIVENLQRK